MIRKKNTFLPIASPSEGGKTQNRFIEIDSEIVLGVQPSERLTLSALNTPIESPFQHVPENVVEGSET